jgi:hypothetical protein
VAAARRTGLIVAAAALLLAIGGLVAWGLRDSDPFVACLGAGDDAARAACLEPQFDAAARSNGTATVLARLYALSIDGAIDDCHMLAHHFGHAAYPAFRDVAAAFRAGSGVCRYGYYHGVVEAAIGNVEYAHHHHAGAVANETSPQEPFDVTRVCPALLDEGSLYSQCIHSVGHGMMHRFAYDAERALTECGKLDHSDEADHVGLSEFELCMNGVFMENVMRHMELDDASFRASAASACAPPLMLPAWMLEACHERIGEVAMYYYGHDMTRATLLCQGVADAPGASDACEKGAADELRSRDADREGGFR